MLPVMPGAHQGLGGLFPEIPRDGERGMSAGSAQSAAARSRTPGTGQRSRQFYDSPPSVTLRSYATTRILGSFIDPDVESDYIMFNQAYHGPLVWSSCVCAAMSIAYAVSRFVSSFRSNIGVVDASLAPFHVVIAGVWLLLAGLRFYVSRTKRHAASSSTTHDADNGGRPKPSNVSDTTSNADLEADDLSCPDCLSPGSVSFEYFAAVALALHCILWASTLVASTQEVQCYDNLNSPSAYAALNTDGSNTCTRGSPPFDGGFLPLLVLGFKFRFSVVVPIVVVYFAFVVGTGLSSSTLTDATAQASVAVLAAYEVAVSLIVASLRDREARQQFVRRKEHAEQLVSGRLTVAVIQHVGASVLPPAIRDVLLLGVDNAFLQIYASDIAVVVVMKLANLDKTTVAGTIGELREALSLKHTLLQHVENVARATRVTRVGFFGDQLWAVSNLIEKNLDDLSPEMKSKARSDGASRICTFSRRILSVVSQLAKTRSAEGPAPLWEDVRVKAGIEIGPVRGIVPGSCGAPVLHVNGRTVRVATRLCELAPADSIYLTEAARLQARLAFMTSEGPRLKVEGEFITVYILGTAYMDDSVSTNYMSSVHTQPGNSINTHNNSDAGSLDHSHRGHRINVISVPRSSTDQGGIYNGRARSVSSSQSSAGRYIHEEPSVLLAEEIGNSNSSSFSRAEKTDEGELANFLQNIANPASLTIDGNAILGYTFSQPEVEAEYRTSGSATSDIAIMAFPLSVFGLTILIVFASLGGESISWKTGIISAVMMVLPLIAYFLLRNRKLNFVLQTILRWVTFVLTLAAVGGCDTWNTDMKNMLRVNSIFAITVALASRVAVMLPTHFPLVLDFAIANLAMQAFEYLAIGAVRSVSARVYFLIVGTVLHTVVARAADLHSRRSRLGVEEIRLAVQHYDDIRKRATITTCRLLPRRCADIVCSRGVVAPADVMYAPSAIVLVIVVKPTSVVSLSNSPATSPTSKPQDGNGFGNQYTSFGLPPVAPTPSESFNEQLLKHPSASTKPPSRAGTNKPGTAKTNATTMRVESDLSFAGRKFISSRTMGSEDSDFHQPRHVTAGRRHVTSTQRGDNDDDIGALVEEGDDDHVSQSPGHTRVLMHGVFGGRSTRAGSISSVGSTVQPIEVNHINMDISMRSNDENPTRPTTQPSTQAPLELTSTHIGRTPQPQLPPLLQITETKTELNLTPLEEEEVMLTVAAHLEDSALVESGAVFVTRGVDCFIVVGNFNPYADSECDGMELLGLGQGLISNMRIRDLAFTVRGGLCTGSAAGAFVGGSHRAYDIVGPALARATSLAREAPDATFLSAANPTANARPHFHNQANSRSVSATSEFSLSGEFLRD